MLPAGEPVEQLLRKAQFFVPGGSPSPDFREVHRKGGRHAEEFYRERWRHDKVVRSTHGVNCTGSCSWKVYVKARGATLRRDLIDVAARTARHGHGHITLHLPEAWHREHTWMTLFTATCGPPQAAA